MAKAETVLERHLLLRRLISQKNSREAILEAMRKKYLKYPLRTYYNDLTSIKGQDVKWMHDMAKGEFTHLYRSTIDSLEVRQRQLAVIADQAPEFRDKIEAIKVIAELDVVIINLIAKGPTVMAVESIGQTQTQLAKT